MSRLALHAVRSARVHVHRNIRRDLPWECVILVRAWMQ